MAELTTSLRAAAAAIAFASVAAGLTGARAETACGPAATARTFAYALSSPLMGETRDGDPVAAKTVFAEPYPVLVEDTASPLLCIGGQAVRVKAGHILTTERPRILRFSSRFSVDERQMLSFWQLDSKLRRFLDGEGAKAAADFVEVAVGEGREDLRLPITDRQRSMEVGGRGRERGGGRHVVVQRVLVKMPNEAVQLYQDLKLKIGDASHAKGEAEAPKGPGVAVFVDLSGSARDFSGPLLDRLVQDRGDAPGNIRVAAYGGPDGETRLVDAYGASLAREGARAALAGGVALGETSALEALLSGGPPPAALVVL
ncbi:MAG: hypothetical protein AAFU61_04360, partial [Pseudomonadota bacterium]